MLLFVAPEVTEVAVDDDPFELALVGLDVVVLLLGVDDLVVSFFQGTGSSIKSCKVCSINWETLAVSSEDFAFLRLDVDPKPLVSSLRKEEKVGFVDVVCG
jgi:hypothetical protein